MPAPTGRRLGGLRSRIPRVSALAPHSARVRKKVSFCSFAATMLAAGLFGRMPAGTAKVWYGADAASLVVGGLYRPTAFLSSRRRDDRTAGSHSPGTAP